MKILALITEYNPFHNGHLYHLNKSKEITNATHTIALMSGNFLQRGEPAIIHKWNRARMAVNSGVDLVMELPTLYACSTAEFFAYGALSLLDKLGAIDSISFGSEVGDLTLLAKVADILVNNPSEFSTILKEYVNLGFTFPLARSKAIIEYLRETEDYKDDQLALIGDIINNPNNILGIEYLKAIKNLNSPITPYTISRKSAHYNNKNISTNSIASATAIREYILNNQSLSGIDHVLPNSVFNTLLANIDSGFAPVSAMDFEESIFSILRRSSLNDIRNVFDVVEGLENRIYQCSIKTNALSELYDCIKSKRYTLTRLQRILMHTLLNINKNDISYCNEKGGPQYGRVLGFNTRGREILKTLKTTSSIPIISNLKNYSPQNKAAEIMLDLDIRATNIYSLAFKNKTDLKAPLDYTMNPFYG